LAILFNAALCYYCNDIIVSRHVHDFVTCSCRNLSIDGGHEYLRGSAKKLDEFEPLTITSDMDTLETFRKLAIIILRMRLSKTETDKIVTSICSFMENFVDKPSDKESCV